MTIESAASGKRRWLTVLVLAVPGLGTPLLFWWVLRPPVYVQDDAAVAATLGGLLLVLTATVQTGLVVAQRDHESAVLAKALRVAKAAAAEAQLALDAASTTADRRADELRKAESELWHIGSGTSTMSRSSTDAALEAVTAKHKALESARQLASDALAQKLSLDRTVATATDEIVSRKGGRWGRALPWAMLLFGTGLVVLPDLATTLKPWR